MKYLLLFAALFLASPNEQKVYICTGPKSECYHKKKECRGLKNRSKEVKVVTLANAKKMGRRPCGYCYKK